jgi:transcriptional regulator with XRE-family HTH domain
MKRSKRTYPTLKAWREATGLNQREAAQILGTTQTTYSRFERQARAPKPERAKAISQKTGVPFESVLGVA